MQGCENGKHPTRRRDRHARIPAGARPCGAPCHPTRRRSGTRAAEPRPRGRAVAVPRPLARGDLRGRHRHRGVAAGELAAVADGARHRPSRAAHRHELLPGVVAVGEQGQSGAAGGGVRGRAAVAATGDGWRGRGAVGVAV